MILPRRRKASLIGRVDELIVEGRIEEAARLLRVPLRASPNDADLLLRAAIVEPDESRTAVLARELANLAEDDPDKLQVCASLLFHSGELDDAAECVARAAALLPHGIGSDPDLLHVAGRIAAVREQNEHAEPMLRMAYEATPERPHRGAAFAEILAIQERYVEALEVVRASLGYFPDDEWLQRLHREISVRMPEPFEPPPRSDTAGPYDRRCGRRRG